jgi:hypothetical protein
MSYRISSYNSLSIHTFCWPLSSGVSSSNNRLKGSGFGICRKCVLSSPPDNPASRLSILPDVGGTIKAPLPPLDKPKSLGGGFTDNGA